MAESLLCMGLVMLIMIVVVCFQIIGAFLAYGIVILQFNSATTTCLCNCNTAQQFYNATK